MSLKHVFPNHILIAAQNNGHTENESNNSANVNTTTDIQQFVLLLKTKLEKSNLKKLICEIKTYKEHGNIEPLMKLLQECRLQEIISTADIKKFRPFVRKDDETLFDAMLMT